VEGRILHAVHAVPIITRGQQEDVGSIEHNLWKNACSLARGNLPNSMQIGSKLMITSHCKSGSATGKCVICLNVESQRISMGSEGPQTF